MTAKIRRALSVMLAIVMVFSLAVSAGAVAGPEDAAAASSSVKLSIDPASITLSGDEMEILSVRIVHGSASDVSMWTWASSNESVVTVYGDGTDALVTANGDGRATVSVIAYGAGGSQLGSAKCSVTVSGSSYGQVSVSGGASISMKVGSERNLSGSVSGGSGSYTYEWTSQGSVGIRDKMRQNASIYAMSAGTGYVCLTVYDAANPSVYDSTTWTVSVEGSSTPMSASISPSRVSLSAGGTTSLSVNVSGGSGSKGNYTYNWYSTSGKIAVYGQGYSAQITATGTGSATVNVDVYDNATGAVVTASAVVSIEGGSKTYNASGSTSVGYDYYLDSIANSLSTQFSRSFGTPLNTGATIQFTSPSGSIGVLRARNGNQVRAYESISIGSLPSIYLQTTYAGTFSTGYTLSDGGNSLSGTITVTASGGQAVTNATISNSVLDMSPYSSRYLNVSVSPANAPCDISWSSSNERIAYVSGSGLSVTVYTQGATGTATITAIVTGTNGGRVTRTCQVNVTSASTYNPTLSVTLGSDYYGTATSDSMAQQFYNVFGQALNVSAATIRFSSMGNERYGIMHTANGSKAVANTTYSFTDWINMYFEPRMAGTYSLPYTLTYNNQSLSGTFDIYIREANISVSISQTDMKLSTYSNQTLTLNVTPASVYYKVVWSSSNTDVATVVGSGDTATVSTTGKAGTSTVTATVTDRNGVEIRRSCTVKVDNRESSYSPSVSTTIGVPYRGTGTSDAMKSQFLSVYNTTLSNSATIRFSSTGDNGIAVMRLADGTPIKANTDYTLSDYIAMYTDPVSAGMFSVPYTLTYSGNSLTGNVIVNVSGGSVTASLSLNGTDPYTFSKPSADGATGSEMLKNAITNGLGSNWSYIRFGLSSSSVGTLHKDSERTSLDGVSIYQRDLDNLYFRPTSTGDYSISFTVYNSQGGNISTGMLYIRVTASAAPEGVVFGDVSADDWYALPVQWAVNRGITNGMGKLPGTDKQAFEPGTDCTVAHILTFLWRSQGSPAPTISNPFSDVKSDDWFCNAAVWAYEKGLVSGTAFNGESKCTRAAAVVFMWKLAGRPGAQESRFSDVTPGTEIASAVDWAVSKNIVGGVGNDKNGIPMFAPDTVCNRGTIVTLLYRAYA